MTGRPLTRPEAEALLTQFREARRNFKPYNDPTDPGLDDSYLFYLDCQERRLAAELGEMEQKA